VLEANESLPAVEDAQVDTIYMKLAYESRLEPNIYEEYMVINGAWEIIGNTKIDLSDYATKEFVENKGYLTEVKTGVGLKITGETATAPVIELDEEIVFILDCGTSTINI